MIERIQCRTKGTTMLTIERNSLWDVFSYDTDQALAGRPTLELVARAVVAKGEPVLAMFGDGLWQYAPAPNLVGVRAVLVRERTELPVHVGTVEVDHGA